MKIKEILIAAGLAGILLLSACGAGQSEPDVPVSEPDPAAAAPVQEERGVGVREEEFEEIFEGLEPREEESGEEESPESYYVVLDEVAVDGSYDEICGFGLSYPQTRDAQFSALNELFSEDLNELKNKISWDVCDEASARGCIATVDGSYEEYQDGFLLSLDYVLRVRYSDSDAEQTLVYSVQYDLKSCERVEE